MSYSHRTLGPLVFIVTVSAVLLSSCTGKDTPPSLSDVVPVRTVTVGSELVSTGIVSSGAHERNTLQYDIIQGIQVPPEPDPVINNATLTGIDINENGVRDDVERALANFGNQSWRIYAIDAIKYARFGMDDASKMKGYYCNITKINPSISNRLQHLIYNTKERLDYYKLTPETSAIDCDKYINQELSKLEIINGLEVPNDPPTETNNLTLAGVDANNNGIRDDVERLIVQVYNGKDSLLEAMQVGINGQKILSDTTFSGHLVHLYDCARLSLNSVNAGVLHSSIFNTQARREHYQNFLPKSGTELHSGESKNCISETQRPYYSEE